MPTFDEWAEEYFKPHGGVDTEPSVRVEQMREAWEAGRLQALEEAVRAACSACNGPNPPEWNEFEEAYIHKPDGEFQFVYEWCEASAIRSLIREPPTSATP